MFTLGSAMDHHGQVQNNATSLTAWFHCFSGVAGDMAMGALIDAGADLGFVRRCIEGLELPGWVDWGIEARPVLRCGVAGTRVEVTTAEQPGHRAWAEIDAALVDSPLPDRVRHRARTVFEALAEVEGALHAMPPAHVHFHEVGAMDAVIDIVGVCAALESLNIDEVRCSPIANGMGTVKMAHGMLPNPAPAVVRLMGRAGAPTYGIDEPMELTTPTGAALMVGMASGFGPLPSMKVEATGFGAGTRELDGRPNLVQVVIGSSHAALPAGETPGQPVHLLEVNVDDVTGETLAHAITRCLEAGAHDAWITPIIMKKGRPAHTVSALADVAVAAQVASVLMAETGSLGVRGSTMDRWPQARHSEIVEVAGVPVRVKVSPGRAKAEHEDVALAARAADLPLHHARAEAEHRWTASHGHEHSHDHMHDGDHGHGHGHEH